MVVAGYLSQINLCARCFVVCKLLRKRLVRRGGRSGRCWSFSHRSRRGCGRPSPAAASIFHFVHVVGEDIPEARPGFFGNGHRCPVVGLDLFAKTTRVNSPSITQVRTSLVCKIVPLKCACRCLDCSGRYQSRNSYFRRAGVGLRAIRLLKNKDENV